MRFADKKIPLAIILTVIAIFVGFNIYNNSKSPASTSPSPTPTQVSTQSLTETYAGKLPCADCEGIEEELTLTKNSANATTGTFILKDTYLGKSIEPISSTGKFEIQTGTPNDPETKVLALNPDNQDEVSYFLMADNTLKMLDKEKKEIDSPFNQTLTKK